MLNPRDFLEVLRSKKVSFFTGVPDSLLKDFCACIDAELTKDQHIIAANEGGAVAIAAGNYLATGDVPVVYMQNSGLGNSINPLLSLADPEVYGIPMLLIIGWRGEPGVKDEPQHVKQGPVTPILLKCLGIPHSVLPDSKEASEQIIEDALRYTQENVTPYAILVKKGTFEKYDNKSIEKNDSAMSREEVLEKIIKNLSEDAVFVGTTGKLSRELFELREARSESHEKDFLTVGSMGHASQIALGIAEAKREKLIVCLDGDGAALMHLGGLATIGTRKPENYVHIIFNNGVHESVGGQMVTGQDVQFTDVAIGLGYRSAVQVSTEKELTKELANIKKMTKPAMIDCIVRPGSREGLGRPTTSPRENKSIFMKNLEN